MRVVGTGGPSRTAYYVGAAIAIFAALAFAVLWYEPADVLKHVGDVASAVGPIMTFLTVVAAALGWVVSARLAGEEARKTESAKRRVADAAYRDFVRARLDRVWGIIDEAVGVKPYQPNVVERFVTETEDLYWRAETFQAFTAAEHRLIREALDRARVDNALTVGALTDDALRRSGKRPMDVIREYFQSSLLALEVVFRNVFDDGDLADKIALRHREGSEWVARMYERQDR